MGNRQKFDRYSYPGRKIEKKGIYIPLKRVV